MITRFDHAVIAVRDLAAALGQFRRLGFDGRPGGRHTGRGTENAIVRFGLDYIELISVYDRPEARQSGWGGAALVDYLDEHDGGFVGFCLATDNIEGSAEALKTRLPGTQGPLDMQRRRPDGEVLRWRLAIPGRSPWLSSYPFLIEWAMPDSERLALETPGSHENGAGGVRRLTISVPEEELEWIRALYGDTLQLHEEATRAFQLGSFSVDLVAGESAGPSHLVIAVKDLSAAGRLLEARSVGATLREGALWIDPAASCGAPIALVS